MRRSLGILVGVWWATACNDDPARKDDPGTGADTDAVGGDGNGTDTGTEIDTDTADGPGRQPQGTSGPNVRVDGAEGAGVDPDSAGVRMCVADGRAVIVAWSDDRTGHEAVFVRRSPDGGVTWPDPPIRFGPDEGARAPALACDGSRVHVAWEDLRDGNPNVYVATSTNAGTSFGSGVLATGDASGAFVHLGPQLAAAGGRVHVTWYDDAHGAYDIAVATSTDGGARFDAPVALGSDPPGSAWSAHPVIAADGEGRVHVAWEDRRTGLVDVHVSTSTDGGRTFARDRRVDDGQGDSYGPVLAAAPGGLVDVAWHDERDGEAYEVYLARSSDGGGSFSAPVRVSAGDPPGTADAVLPQLGWAGGQLQVAFEGLLGGGNHVQHARDAGGAPTAPVEVDRSPAHALRPKLATSGDQVIVAWEDDRDAAPDSDARDLYYAWSDDGGARFRARGLRIDSRPPGGPRPSDLAVTLADGHLLAAWADARGGTLDVWFARIVPGTSSSLGGP